MLTGTLESSRSDSHVHATLSAIAGLGCEAPRIGEARLHPFPARMPLAVASFLIDRLTVPDGVVLDPMVGSGTSVVAARALGRVGLGFDLDPLAVILSRASSATADPEALLRAHERVLARAEKRCGRLAGGLQPDHKEFLDYWFPERSQMELFALAGAIQAEKDLAVVDFLWVVFSSLVVAKSAGASYALDLAHTRPHRDLKKKIIWPLEAWTPRLKRLVRDLPFIAGTSVAGKASVWVGDARQTALKDNAVDLVLTSPPYLRSHREAIDYLRAHKFSLVWMGYHLTKLRQLRAGAVGSQRGLYNADGLPVHIESDLIRSISLRPRQGRIRRYLSDLHTILKEVHRILKPGALAVIAFGPSILSRTRNDATHVVENLSRSVGLVMVSSVSRELSDSRRTLPPPRRVPGNNSLRKRMRSETFIALRKPARQ